MTCGIYIIINKINGHKYIGQSINIEKRFKEHKKNKDYKHSAIDLAIKKYGSKNFIYQIITILPKNSKIIDKHERYWIKFYNTYENKKHYNLTPGGDFNPMKNPKNAQKVSKKLIGHVVPSKTRKKISKKLKGRQFSPKTIKKMSESKIGEKNHKYKKYARIVKSGKINNKQRYSIFFQGRRLKSSINLNKLKKWFQKNYPNETIKEVNNE